jgi:GNAT superfamily N-acetyltransferase
MPGVKVLIKGLNKVIDFPVGSKMDDIGKHIQGNWSSVEEMSGLPMDAVSRKERAKYMGFDTSQSFFHGTNAEFDEFIPSETGVLGPGIYTTKSKVQAGKYGDTIKEINVKADKPISSKPFLEGDAEKISSQLDGFLVDDYKTPYENWVNIKQSFGADKATEVFKNAGYDALEHKNYIIPFDPKNIRSVNAAFDPSKKESANLLAGVGAAAVGVSAMSPEEAEAGALGKAGKSIAQEMKRLHPNIKSFITESDGVVTLQKVVVDKESRGAGEGTKFMDDFLRLADEKGSKAALTPTSDFGGNKKRLEGFYERFGFTPNKGKTKDFSISESLIREPKALAATGIIYRTSTSKPASTKKFYRKHVI